MPCLVHSPLASQCRDHTLSAGAQHCDCSPAGARFCAELLGKGMGFPSSTQAERRLSLQELSLFIVLSPWPHFAENPASPLAWEWRLRLGWCGDNARSRYMVTNALGRWVEKPLTEWTYFSYLTVSSATWDALEIISHTSRPVPVGRIPWGISGGARCWCSGDWVKL